MSINAVTISAIANLFLFDIFSLNIKKPPRLISNILPAVNTGYATDAFTVSKDSIRKQEEKRLGIPTANPVRISFILNLALSFKVKIMLIENATKNIQNKNTALQSFNAQF